MQFLDEYNHVLNTYVRGLEAYILPPYSIIDNKEL